MKSPRVEMSMADPTQPGSPGLKQASLSGEIDTSRSQVIYDSRAMVRSLNTIPIVMGITIDK